MSERKRAAEFASKRMLATRSMELRAQKILFPVAKAIVALSAKYRIKNRISNEKAFLAEARSIAAEAAEALEEYTSAYSLVSCRLLGIGSDNVSKFVSGLIFGKTVGERNSAYLANFAEDIVRMVKAGILMGYPESKILSAVRTGYKNPYSTSVITKAKRKDINIATPSYGKGVFRNAYRNIVRNAQQTISLAWGEAEQEYGKDNGAVGFRVYRGSSFPCAVCDDECSYVHSFRDPHPPFHVNCVCYTRFIYKE